MYLFSIKLYVVTSLSLSLIHRVFFTRNDPKQIIVHVKCQLFNLNEKSIKSKINFLILRAKKVERGLYPYMYNVSIL